jgi:hypothetical protein
MKLFKIVTLTHTVILKISIVTKKKNTQDFYLYADAVTIQNSEHLFYYVTIKNSELIFEELAFIHFYCVTIKTIYSVTNNNQNLQRG